MGRRDATHAEGAVVFDRDVAHEECPSIEIAFELPDAISEGPEVLFADEADLVIEGGRGGHDKAEVAREEIKVEQLHIDAIVLADGPGIGIGNFVVGGDDKARQRPF